MDDIRATRSLSSKTMGAHPLLDERITTVKAKRHIFIFPKCERRRSCSADRPSSSGRAWKFSRHDLFLVSHLLNTKDHVVLNGILDAAFVKARSEKANEERKRTTERFESLLPRCMSSCLLACFGGVSVLPFANDDGARDMVSFTRRSNRSTIPRLERWLHRRRIASSCRED